MRLPGRNRSNDWHSRPDIKKIFCVWDIRMFQQVDADMIGMGPYLMSEEADLESLGQMENKALFQLFEYDCGYKTGNGAILILQLQPPPSSSSGREERLLLNMAAMSSCRISLLLLNSEKVINFTIISLVSNDDPFHFGLHLERKNSIAGKGGRLE